MKQTRVDTLGRGLAIHRRSNERTANLEANYVFAHQLYPYIDSCRQSDTAQNTHWSISSSLLRSSDINEQWV